MADNPSAGGGKIRSKRAALQRKPYSRAPRKVCHVVTIVMYQLMGVSFIAASYIFVTKLFQSFLTKVSDSVKSILTPITPRWLVNFRGNEEQQSSAQSDLKGLISQQKHVHDCLSSYR